MIKNIIFDFDGVILESNEVKIQGFFKLFEQFGEENSLKISNYFKNNAGLSRYDIINYFFLVILNEEMDKIKLTEYANKYSDIVKESVVNSKFVIGIEKFLSQNTQYELFIVSSSDEKDLKYICNKLNIDKYFKSIIGSPTKKADNINNIINNFGLKKNETVYVGDSLNDYHATIKNDLTFIGRDSGLCDFTQLRDIIIIKDIDELNKYI